LGIARCTSGDTTIPVANATAMVRCDPMNTVFD